MRKVLATALIFACFLLGTYIVAIYQSAMVPTPDEELRTFIPPGILSSWGTALVPPPSFPTVPSEIPRLKVIYREVTPELVTKVAKEIFGFTGEVKEGSGTLNLLDAVEGGALRVVNYPYDKLCIYGSGKIKYYHGPEHIYSPITTLTNEGAKKVADNFLEKVKELLPQNPDVKMELRKVGPGSVQIFETPGKNGIGYIRQIDYLSVIYGIKFKEFPIEGAYVVIRVREGGIVEDFALIWREFEEENGSIPVITPEEALERLRCGKIIDEPLSSIRKVTIENIKLGYYLVPPIELSKQDYLIPVYLFYSAFIDSGGSEGNWTFIVPAAVKPEQWTTPIPLSEDVRPARVPLRYKPENQG